MQQKPAPGRNYIPFKCPKKQICIAKIIVVGSCYEPESRSAGSDRRPALGDLTTPGDPGLCFLDELRGCEDILRAKGYIQSRNMILKLFF